jgi:hypothetical protein
MSIPLPGRLPLARLRPCGRSRRSRAPFDVRPRSPRTLVARHESIPVVDEWTAVPSCPARLDVPFGPPHPMGKMRLPNVCNRQLLRAPCGPPDSSSCYRTGRSSLDVELRASAWPAMAPVSRTQSPLGPVGASIKGPSERRSLAPHGLFGRGKVACLASDAPCRTLSPVIEPQGDRAPEPFPPPPRQRLRLSRPEAPGRPAPLPPSALSSSPLAQETRQNERSACIASLARGAATSSPKARSPETVLVSAAIHCDPRARPRIARAPASRHRGKRPKPASHSTER